MILDFHTHSIEDIILQLKLQVEDSAYMLSILEFLEEWISKDQFAIVSSGTTGVKKQILFPKKALIKSALISIDAFNLSKGDSVINALPLNFIAGKMMFVRAIVGELLVLVLEPSSNPIKDLEKKITFSAFTPYQLQHILAETPNKLELIEKVIIGGSKIERDLESKIQNTTTRVFETFGMSETLTHFAFREVNGMGKSEYYSVLPDFEIYKNEDDCLLIKAKHLGTETIETKDIVELKGKGKFIWKGRIDNVINSGGIKLFPEEIEEKLSNRILAPFVIVKALDDVLGEKVILVIESTEEFDNLDFSVLSKYELPKEIRYVDSLPRNANGKIMRFLLNE